LGVLIWIFRIFEVTILFIILINDNILYISLQYTAFAIAGSKLIQRIRSKAFACLLRQEVGYFDRPENSCGAIYVRLSSDALAVQEMAGARLGIICESFSMSCFGLLFGIFFSWQLTMIVFFALVFQGIIAVLETKLSKRLKEETDLILQRASTVRLYY